MKNTTLQSNVAMGEFSTGNRSTVDGKLLYGNISIYFPVQWVINIWYFYVFPSAIDYRRVFMENSWSNLLVKLGSHGGLQVPNLEIGIMASCPALDSRLHLAPVRWWIGHLISESRISSTKWYSASSSWHCTQLQFYCDFFNGIPGCSP